MSLRVGVLSSVLCLLACTSAPDEAPEVLGPSNVDPLERDVRVPIPDPDPAYADIASPEFVINPGEERVWCAHTQWNGDDFAFDNHQILQGPFGHHAGIVLPEEPRPPGSVEDCTDAASSAKFVKNLAVATPLPPGYATLLAKGTPIVVQSHYINTSRQPIRVRDVMRLHRVATESVTKWVRPFTTRMLDGIDLPARTTTTQSFDCTVPADGEIVLLLGHMHERGRSISIEHASGREAPMTTIYRVAEWQPKYRDAPPIEGHFDDPIVLRAGDVLRTTCTWDNHEAESVRYPEEMCLGWGYYVGAGGSFDCVGAPRVAGVTDPTDPSPG